MTVLAKLLTLEAIKILDPVADRLLIRLGGANFVRRARPGEKLDFAFSSEEPLLDGVKIDDQIEVRLNREDLEGGHGDFYGVVTIKKDEVDRGKRTHQFMGKQDITGHPFHYELTYEVLPLPEPE